MMIEKEVIAPTEQKRMMETAAHSIKRIKCQRGRFQRRQFDASMEGIWVHCKECRRAHLHTWDELFLLREAFRPVLMAIEEVS